MLLEARDSLGSKFWEPADWADVLLPVASYIRLITTKFRSTLDSYEGAIQVIMADLGQAMALLPSASSQQDARHRVLQATYQTLLRCLQVGLNVL